MFSDKASPLFCVRLGMGLMVVASMTLVLLAISTPPTDAYPLNGNEMARKHPITVEIENPEEVLSVLDNLMQNILAGYDYSRSGVLVGEKSAGNKRGIDLGLSRGFSGNQAAKHMMGLQAASFGPGRKRK